jgi:hypothetical protein
VRLLFAGFHGSWCVSEADYHQPRRRNDERDARRRAEQRARLRPGDHPHQPPLLGRRDLGLGNGRRRIPVRSPVFPEHADNPEWEIGESKISKLWIARIKNKEQVFNWDRGPDHPAATKKTQAVVDFLAGGLADYIYYAE